MYLKTLSMLSSGSFPNVESANVKRGMSHVQKMFVCLLVMGMCATEIRSETFIVDTNKSSIAISGSTLGSAFQEQGANSLVTHFTGQFQASVTETNIQFIEGTSLVALDNNSWQPNADGSDGSALANYGATVSVLFSSGKAALRKVQLNALSPAINVTDGQFDSSGLTFNFPTNSDSSFAYRITGLLAQSGNFILSGYATNNVTTKGSFKTIGDQQILTLPIDAQFKFKLLSDGDTVVNLKGEIIASRDVQAPLIVQSITAKNQVVTIRWVGVPNQSNLLESSPDLRNWNLMATNVVSPTADFIWSGSVTSQYQFYRIGR